MMIQLRSQREKSPFFQDSLRPMCENGWKYIILVENPMLLLLVRSHSSIWEPDVVNHPDVLDYTDKVLYSKQPNKYKSFALRPVWNRGIGLRESRNGYEYHIRLEKKRSDARCRALNAIGRRNRPQGTVGSILDVTVC
jgi:hypothetical protein